jgi:multicomponent Na+:H+ antiporter subunit C
MEVDTLSSVNYWLAATLFLIGIYGILARPHLVRKLMAMNILQVAVIVFFIILGFKSDATPPIVRHGDETPVARDYINPLPHTLMLTAIVVSVSTTGVALALLIRIHRRYGTLDETELIEKLK